MLCLMLLTLIHWGIALAIANHSLILQLIVHLIQHVSNPAHLVSYGRHYRRQVRVVYGMGGLKILGFKVHPSYLQINVFNEAFSTTSTFARGV